MFLGSKSYRPHARERPRLTSSRAFVQFAEGERRKKSALPRLGVFPVVLVAAPDVPDSNAGVRVNLMTRESRSLAEGVSFVEVPEPLLLAADDGRQVVRHDARRTVARWQLVDTLDIRVGRAAREQEARTDM